MPLGPWAAGSLGCWARLGRFERAEKIRTVPHPAAEATERLPAVAHPILLLSRNHPEVSKLRMLGDGIVAEAVNELLILDYRNPAASLFDIEHGAVRTADGDRRAVLSGYAAGIELEQSACTQDGQEILIVAPIALGSAGISRSSSD